MVFWSGCIQGRCPGSSQQHQRMLLMQFCHLHPLLLLHRLLFRSQLQ